MFGVTDDYSEKIVEVVSDATRELPHRLHLLRLLKLLLGQLARGQIMNDPDENRLAILLGFTDRQIHREGRSVFPKSDDFATNADNFSFGGLQEIFDVVVVLHAICRRHQQLDVFVHDFVCAIPKQPFASRIKQQDAALRSEEHTSELQSHLNLVCRLLLEKTTTST